MLEASDLFYPQTPTLTLTVLFVAQINRSPHLPVSILRYFEARLSSKLY